MSLFELDLRYVTWHHFSLQKCTDTRIVPVNQLNCLI